MLNTKVPKNVNKSQPLNVYTPKTISLLTILKKANTDLTNAKRNYIQANNLLLTKKEESLTLYKHYEEFSNINKTNKNPDISQQINKLKANSNKAYKEYKIAIYNHEKIQKDYISCMEDYILHSKNFTDTYIANL